MKNLALIRRIMCIFLLGDFSGPDHTKPEGFGNGGFTLKRYQVFSVHTKLEEFVSDATLDLCLTQTRSGKSRDYREIIERRFQNVFRRTHGNEK